MLAIGIIAIVVIAALYMIPAYDWEDGAPEATIYVSIEKSDSSITYAGDVEIEPISQLDKALTTYPLTSYTADVAPLEPESYYTIAFIVTVTVLGNVAETYTTTVTVSGSNAKTIYPITGQQGPLTFCQDMYGNNPEIELTQGMDYNVPQPFAIPTFAGCYQTTNTDNRGEIKGEFIDGSIFEIAIVSQSFAGSYGMTTATVQIVVGAGGTLSVQIDSITTSVG